MNKLERLLELLEEGKAEDVCAIDLRGKADFAEDMVIATGRSSTQLRALTERLQKYLKDSGDPPLAVSGLSALEWVCLDANDVVVHLFLPEVRDYYQLEKLWIPAPLDEQPAEVENA